MPAPAGFVEEDVIEALPEPSSPAGFVDESPAIPNIRKAPPAGIMEQVIGFFRDEDKRVARAQNIYALSDVTGLPLNEVNKNYETLRSSVEITGISREPTETEVLQGLLLPGVVAGAIANPIGTAAGLLAFGALDKAIPTDKLIDKMNEEGIDDDVVKMVELADFIGKSMIAGGVYRKSRSIPETFLKRKITEYKLPETVTLKPEQVQDIYKTGELTTPEEKSLWAALELNSFDRRAALERGISINVPAEKIVRVIDNPLWAKVKNMFGKSEAEPLTTKTKVGEPKKATAGLIQAGSEAIASGEISEGAIKTPLSSTSKMSTSLTVAGRNLPSSSTDKSSILGAVNEKILSSNRENFLSDFSIATPSNKDYTRFYEKVQENISPFENALREIQGIPGVEGWTYRIKRISSMSTKLGRKKGRSIGSIDDVLAASVATKPGMLDKVISEMSLNFPGLRATTDYRKEPTFLGYRGYHAEVDLPNGQAAEIQFFDGKEQIARKFQAHEIYTKWRRHIESNAGGAGTYAEVEAKIKAKEPHLLDEFRRDIDKSKRTFSGEEVIEEKYVTAAEASMNAPGHEIDKLSAYEIAQQTKEVFRGSGGVFERSAARSFESTVASGGATLQPLTENVPSKGFSYVEDRGRSVLLNGPVTKEAILDFINKNQDAWKDKNNHIGLWIERDNNGIIKQSYVEVSKVAETEAEAMAAVEGTTEKAIYDLGSKKTIQTKYGKEAENADRTIPDKSEGLDTGETGRTGFQDQPGQAGPQASQGPKATSPVQKVISALKEAESIRAKQETLYEKARSQKFAKLQSARKTAVGERGFYKELGALKGELPKVEFESIREKVGQEDIDALFQMIRESKKIGEWEKINAMQGLGKIFGEFGGRVPTEGEIALLDQVFGKEFTKVILEKRPLFEKMLGIGYEIANIPRSVMASFDLSAPLRQGIFLIGRQPQFAPAFAKMFGAFASDKAYLAIQDAIIAHPHYQLARDSKLALTDLDVALGAREEQFMSSWAEKIPLLGKGVRASSRAYIGFLNKLRFDVFADLVNKSELIGLDPKKDRDLAANIADFINNATGRGTLPGALSKAAVALNTAFFSPRLLFSRLNLLNPVYYAKLDPFVRKEALKSLFSFAGIGFTILALLKMAGADVGDEPRSSDFGKAKIDNTRFDIWGGFQPLVRVSAQLLTGKYISSTTGKEMTLGEGYKPMTRADIVQRFVEGKLAPIPSFVVALLKQVEPGTGKPVKAEKEIAKRFVPMVIGDLYDLAKEQPELLPAGMLAFFGVGVQTYEDKKRGKF